MNNKSSTLSSKTRDVHHAADDINAEYFASLEHSGSSSYINFETVDEIEIRNHHRATMHAVMGSNAAMSLLALLAAAFFLRSTKTYVGLKYYLVNLMLSNFIHVCHQLIDTYGLLFRSFRTRQLYVEKWSSLITEWVMCVYILSTIALIADSIRRFRRGGNAGTALTWMANLAVVNLVPAGLIALSILDYSGYLHLGPYGKSIYIYHAVILAILTLLTIILFLFVFVILCCLCCCRRNRICSSEQATNGNGPTISMRAFLLLITLYVFVTIIVQFLYSYQVHMEVGEYFPALSFSPQSTNVNVSSTSNTMSSSTSSNVQNMNMFKLLAKYKFLIEKFIYASNWALLLKPVIEAVAAIFCVAILGCLARKTSQARATYSLRSSKVPLSYIDHQLHTDHINVLRPSSA